MRVRNGMNGFGAAGEMEASSWTFSDNGDSDTSADSSDEDRDQHGLQRAGNSLTLDPS